MLWPAPRIQRSNSINTNSLGQSTRERSPTVQSPWPPWCRERRKVSPLRPQTSGSLRTNTSREAPRRVTRRRHSGQLIWIDIALGPGDGRAQGPKMERGWLGFPRVWVVPVWRSQRQRQRGSWLAPDGVPVLPGSAIGLVDPLSWAGLKLPGLGVGTIQEMAPASPRAAMPHRGAAMRRPRGTRLRSSLRRKGCGEGVWRFSCRRPSSRSWSRQRTRSASSASSRCRVNGGVLGWLLRSSSRWRASSGWIATGESGAPKVRGALLIRWRA